MKLLKSTLMASALILGTASVSFAQDVMVDKAKDVMVDKATDMAKDKAIDMAGDKVGGMVDPAMDVGKDMMKGDSLKDAAMKAGESEMKDKAKSYGSGTTGAVLGASDSMDSKDAMTAGKVLLNGGSKEEAAMAVAKDNAKDAVMDKADSMMKEKMIHGGTIKSAPSYGSGTPAPAAASTPSYGSGTPAAASTSSYGSGTAASTPAPAASVNCPSGTTAQPNGTCMVTGNYQPRS